MIRSQWDEFVEKYDELEEADKKTIWDATKEVDEDFVTPFLGEAHDDDNDRDKDICDQQWNSMSK